MKRPRLYWRAALALSLLLMLPACKAEDAPAEPALDPAGSETYFSITVGSASIDAQLAVTNSEMKQGLMHRKSLGENRGMLFVYEKPDQLGFWMRNTFIPLDIGFFDSNGVLKEVRKLYPHDETSVRSRDDNIQFALETNAGWFKRNGLQPGVKIDIKAILADVEARGLDPDRFQLPASPGP